MNNKRLWILSAAILNTLITILYAVAIIMMSQRSTFIIGSGDDAVTINFRALTISRALNWSLLFLMSLFITVCLFCKKLRQKPVLLINVAIAITLVVLEFLTFLSPFIRKIKWGMPAKWDFMSTINITVFLIRTYVASVCVYLTVKKIFKK